MLGLHDVKKRNAQKIWVAEPGRENPLQNKGKDGRIILKQVLNKMRRY
jgi:hypothetical protein